MGNNKDFVIQFGCLVNYKGKEKNVVIPDNVTVIGRRAFYQNKYIETVTIPASVTEVQQEAFEYCYNLKEITILGKFSQRFSEFDPNTEVFSDNLKFIGTHLKQSKEYSGNFYHYLIENKDLRHAVLEARTIPAKDLKWLISELQEENQTEMLAEVLEYQNLLLSDEKTRKSLEKSEKRAEGKALSPEMSVSDWRKLLKFSYENGDVVIKEVLMKDPVTVIPDHIGARKVRVIDGGAFAYYLKKGEKELWSPDKIILSEGIEEIRSCAFDCAENTEIFFPSTVKSLPKDCFCAVENLTLHIPASVTEIADELEFDSGEPAFKAIHAPAGSYAEQYAKEHNIPFVAE